nr:MAG TPA: hypothetical protein [Caudoviricetes sp.]
MNDEIKAIFDYYDAQIESAEIVRNHFIEKKRIAMDKYGISSEDIERKSFDIIDDITDAIEKFDSSEKKVNDIIDFHIRYLYIISKINDSDNKWLFGTDIQRLIRAYSLVHDMIIYLVPSRYCELMTYSSCYRYDIMFEKYKHMSEYMIKYVSYLVTDIEVLNNYLIHKMIVEYGTDPNIIIDKSSELVTYNKIQSSLR